METTVNLFGNLHDFLFLQGLADLNEFGTIAALDRTVHVANVRQTHDDVPACLLGKHLVGLRLIHLLCELQGIIPVGHTQQQSLFITFQPPHLQIAGTGHQRTVIVIHRVAKGVIIAVNLTTGFQQFHLIHKAAFRKYADGLFVGGLRPTEWHVEIYNLLHTLANLIHIGIGERFEPLLLEVAIVTATQRVLDEQFRTRKNILRRFV